MTDRVYWHVPGARSWHALVPGTAGRALCGLYRQAEAPDFTPIERADRLPPSAHLCGNCARSIAARTDVES